MTTHPFRQRVIGAFALVTLATAFVSCEDAEEAVTQLTTTTQASSPTQFTSPSLAPPIAATTTATASPTDPIPDTWLTYLDPVLGFSLRYPPDLVLKDLTGPSPQGGLRERDLQFRAPRTQPRGFTVSVIESFPEGISLEDWAWEYAGCPRESIHLSTLDNVLAVRCTREVYEDYREPAMVSEYGGRMFLISGTGLSEAEFDLVFSSFKFG